MAHKDGHPLSALYLGGTQPWRHNRGHPLYAFYLGISYGRQPWIQVWTAIIFVFILALSMNSPLETMTEVNFGLAAQQICPGRDRRCLPLL